jgi:hypothetical protein
VRGVIEDEVHLQLRWDFLVEGLHEFLELDRAVAGMQTAEHLPGREVQGGVEAAGSVPLVVVGRGEVDGETLAFSEPRRFPSG